MKNSNVYYINATVQKKSKIILTHRFWLQLSNFIKTNNFQRVVYVSDDLVVEKLNLLKKISVDDLCVINHGEQQKNIEQFSNILTFFYKENIDKKSLVVVIGGGMVSDITGFASSVYYRGVPLAYVPTTLLSQVDAAIGGKNTINFLDTKNIVGNFYLPNLIIIDPTLIKSLPKREIASGMAEIIKYAVGFDKKLLLLLEKMNDKHSESNRQEELFELIKRSVAIKTKLVEQDLYETGKKRKLLNLGHTLGHALESQDHFSLSHGEAVSIGLLFSLFISKNFGNISQAEFERCLAIFKKYNLPPKIQFSISYTMQRLHYDKKSYYGGINFILLKKLGQSYICQMNFNDIQSQLESFQKFYYSLEG